MDAQKEVYIESGEADVTLIIRVNTVIRFSPIERDRPLSRQDAIDNAIGSIPAAVFAELEGEGFDIAYPIEGAVYSFTRDDDGSQVNA